jgi:hypothetical protein
MVASGSQNVNAGAAYHEMARAGQAVSQVESSRARGVVEMKSKLTGRNS